MGLAGLFIICCKTLITSDELVMSSFLVVAVRYTQQVCEETVSGTRGGQSDDKEYSIDVGLGLSPHTTGLTLPYNCSGIRTWVPSAD